MLTSALVCVVLQGEGTEAPEQRVPLFRAVLDVITASPKKVGLIVEFKQFISKIHDDKGKVTSQESSADLVSAASVGKRLFIHAAARPVTALTHLSGSLFVARGTLPCSFSRHTMM